MRAICAALAFLYAWAALPPSHPYVKVQYLPGITHATIQEEGGAP